MPRIKEKIKALMHPHRLIRSAIREELKEQLMGLDGLGDSISPADLARPEMRPQLEKKFEAAVNIDIWATASGCAGC